MGTRLNSSNLKHSQGLGHGEFQGLIPDLTPLLSSALQIRANYRYNATSALLKLSVDNSSLSYSGVISQNKTYISLRSIFFAPR